MCPKKWPTSFTKYFVSNVFFCFLVQKVLKMGRRRYCDFGPSFFRKFSWNFGQTQFLFQKRVKNVFRGVSRVRFLHFWPFGGRFGGSNPDLGFLRVIFCGSSSPISEFGRYYLKLGRAKNTKNGKKGHFWPFWRPGYRVVPVDLTVKT